MNRRSLSVLIVLNVVLLAAIALTLGPVPKAEAQIGGGSFLMIAGSAAQAQQQVIYVMDSRTGNLVGFTVNSANKKVEIIGGRKVADDIKKGVGTPR
ncbi:MAG: hypothetical protein KTR15_15500 [Phycisphaeraceae bacterium]|nr:hypothetical protein [Phycisphaeraceae bacterium]